MYRKFKIMDAGFYGHQLVEESAEEVLENSLFPQRYLRLILN